MFLWKSNYWESAKWLSEIVKWIHQQTTTATIITTTNGAEEKLSYSRCVPGVFHFQCYFSPPKEGTFSILIRNATDALLSNGGLNETYDVIHLFKLIWKVCHLSLHSTRPLVLVKFSVLWSKWLFFYLLGLYWKLHIHVQVARSHQCKAEAQDHLLQPTDDASFDAS